MVGSIVEQHPFVGRKHATKQNIPDQILPDTTPKTNMESKNRWFVDVYPFPRGHFQVP